MNRRLLFFLLVKAFVMIALILFSGIGLGPDEAQYWTWSRSLDWGYYSKPPGIAWQIWLGTILFGQSEWGVRSFSVFIAIFQAWFIYRLALRANLLPKTAFWCGICMAFTPLGFLGSFFAITDVGFLICWTGACISVVDALNKQKLPNPFKAAGWIIAGALFKWPIYLFWPFLIFIYFWYFPNQKKSSLFLAFFLSLLALLPSIWWNVKHDWATFRHVLATLQGGSGQHRAQGNIVEFLGSQFLLLSPILFLLLIFAFRQWIKKFSQLSPPLFFCGLITFSSLVFIAIVSCFQKVQGNWGIFAYPTGLILLGWYFQQQIIRELWLKIGIGLSVSLSLLLFILPSLYSNPSLNFLAPNFRLNPLKHNMGWATLKEALEKYGYQPQENFLFSDKYQTTSILSFYAGQPKRAYFLNLQGSRKNQFSYWPSLQEEQKNKIGYFVCIENMPHLKNLDTERLHFYKTELEKYFEKVEILDLVPLVYQNSQVVKGAIILRCHHCNHFLPNNNMQLY